LKFLKFVQNKHSKFLITSKKL